MEGAKEIDKLFAIVVKSEASDLHIKTGSPPILRISGRPRELESKALNDQEIQKLLYEIMTPAQIQHFEAAGDCDFAYGIPGVGRFRCNVFRQRGSISLAARRVNSKIPSFEELHLPPVMTKIAANVQGIVLMAGITGSGKSTTLAAMVEYINANRHCHILTIEDPIEYLYRDRKSFINQREIGLDVTSFDQALKTAVRQDPDVMLVGEMRDCKTFSTALTAAETGHLVFSTLHASSSTQAIIRILDLFPESERTLIRKGLVFNMKAIIGQKLLPSIREGLSRIPVTEVLINNPSVQKLIEEGRDKQIQDVVRAGKEEGMHDFNQSLHKLITEKFISMKVGLAHSSNPDQLKMLLKGISLLEQQSGILGS
ncbi:MAG: PilT/PilU family type 4a pilus ATPase [Planctomycetota bacterium]